MNCRLSEYGELLGPAYHDGVVVGVSVTDEAFRIQIEKDGALVGLTISGVRDFGFSPLCRHAIVSNIRAVPEAKWNDLPIGDGSPWRTLSGGQFSDADMHYVPSRLQSGSDRWTLFILDFSSGSSVVVVGSDWAFDQ